MDNNNRLMVRLIDVALIILLGFIAISRLKTEYVDLPAPGNPEPPTQRIMEAKVSILANAFVLQQNGRNMRLSSKEALESAMVQASQRSASRGQKLMFTIESERGSMMQSLIDVLDICQRNQIEKSLDYEKYN
ncbi:MAG: biopolymer transporter ExbD [Deferribacteres bacterium]|nr:biopolymer transporter ExbD [candidate division KSB1 bacterium]MCB9510621.1 biopolymer transporter ExbD [Deferribacteres bacterium]